MGRKHVTNRHRVIANGDMSGNITSEIVDVEQLDHCRFIGEYSGIGLSGSFNIYSSDDKSFWTELEITPLTAVATGESFAILVNQIDFKYIKLTYTSTAGTGALNVYIKGASIGA